MLDQTEGKATPTEITLVADPSSLNCQLTPYQCIIHGLDHDRYHGSSYDGIKLLLSSVCSPSQYATATSEHVPAAHHHLQMLLQPSSSLKRCDTSIALNCHVILWTNGSSSRCSVCGSRIGMEHCCPWWSGIGEQRKCAQKVQNGCHQFIAGSDKELLPAHYGLKEFSCTS